MSTEPFNRLFDPDEVLDWEWDWTPELREGEVITGHQILPTNVTINSSAVIDSGRRVRMWAQDPSHRAQAVCRITTNQGRTRDWTIHWTVTDR